MSYRKLDKHRAKIDFETASVLDVREVGAVKYSEHPLTRVLCMGWQIGRGKRSLWTPDQPFPKELIEFAEQGGVFEAHNAMFECAIWLNVLHKRMGIPMPKRWYDTMARCAQRALPMGLDDVGRVLNLSTQKDKKGKYLLQKLTKPRAPTKTEIKEWAVQHGIEPLPKKASKEAKDDWQTQVDMLPEMPLLWQDGNELVPEKWEMRDGSADPRTLLKALYDYCEQDVAAEHALGEKIGDMDESEYRLWVLDQTINWRGVQVDIDAVESALAIVAEVEEKLGKELTLITGGAVTTGSQVARIKAWAGQQGYEIESLAKDQVEQVLDDGENESDVAYDEDDPEPERGIGDNGGPPLIDDDSTPWQKVERVLQIRQQLSRSSTKKLKRILECMCADGRLRGMLQYHGAGTGRWSGRLAQPHNFPRGNQKIIKKGIEPLIAAIKCRSADLLTMFYGDPMDAISSSLRGMFIAAKGKKLRVADFSAIEARVTMWLAGEVEALEAFRKADRKEGPDIYCVMAIKLYNKPINKDDNPEERQLGKITILGCGYQMGPDKLKFQAKKDYKVDLTDEQASFLVNGYRESFPKVKGLWYGLQDAAINAIEADGASAHSYRGITYRVEYDDAGKWLTCELPNGRKLNYFNPDVVTEQAHSREGKPYFKKSILYYGRDNKQGGRWNCIRTYGGMLTENVVQAISRDIMAESMVRVEGAGYPIILTVHDEIVAETDEEFGNQKEFDELMKECPIWIPDCPINVEGWSGPRYRKA